MLRAYPLLRFFVHFSKELQLRTTKVIKAEFEKLEDLNDEDVSLTCVEVANIPCDSNKDDDSEQRVSHEADDDMGYDPSDVAFTEWLGLKFFNYKTMDHYTKKALWIYWIRGDDEVELTDEEFSDNEDEVAEVFRIDTNIFDFETPMCKTFKEFNYLLQIDPDLLTKDIEGFKTYEELRMIGSMNRTEMYHGLMRNHGLTLDWKNDGYCNGGNLPGAYIVGNSLHYQDYEWYEALKDSELKEQALRNKAIMEGLISDDESCNDAHELSVCNMRRFKMIKYSFGQDEEYVAIKEDEYGDLARTRDDTCRSYEEIFHMIDEGWMVTRAE
ncbi:hypothetical protein Tco_0957905 [Tanacetum coccineum]